MSVISTANLYVAIKRKFSIGQNRLDSFKASFLGAYNDTLFDLYNDSLIDEPTLLTDTSPPTPTNSGIAAGFAPTEDEVYYKTDTAVYYKAIDTSVDTKEFSDTDYWEVVDTYNSAVELRYLPQIKVGIRHYLQSEGEWVKGEDINKYSGLEWGRAKGDIANAIVKETEKDETYTGFWSE